MVASCMIKVEIGGIQMNITTTLMQQLEKDEGEMIAIRRHLHQHPELSFQEKSNRRLYQSLL